MRSVIHEAATIAKAIEQGWIKAGKPKDFTVKIFEEPQKNFLGFTTRKAKVGIFVEDRQQQRQDYRPKKHVPQHRRQQRHSRDRQWSGPRQQQDRPFDRPEGQQRAHPQDRPNQDQGPRDQDHNRDRGHDRRNEPQRPHNPEPVRRNDDDGGENKE